MHTLKSGWVKAALAALALVSATAQAAVAPRIWGSPSKSVEAGKAYAFTPQASDADRDTLRFSITNKPGWATFNASTGRLSGTPTGTQLGTYGNIRIRVSDGQYYRTLPDFSITVTPKTEDDTPPTGARKANYGHYFATRYEDTPADVAMLCGQRGVQGVNYRRTWGEIETAPGVYDWSDFDAALRAIETSHNPQCQLWIFIEFKSFNASPKRNPCPVYLRERYSGLNADGGSAATCFMWEPVVKDAYIRMMKAAAARYDGNPRVEGFILQESALGFNGQYSQAPSDGGTYSAQKWRDALIDMVGACGNAFARSRCLVFLNFLLGGQEYLHDVSRAISAIPNNRGCMSGPDLLPDNTSLTDGKNAVYEVLAKHRGCRSNSAQNASYRIANFNLDQVFNFAVRGTFGGFDESSPRNTGVCVNSYLFWNHRLKDTGAGGRTWVDALPVIAAYPYGRMWLDQCQGGGATP